MNHTEQLTRYTANFIDELVCSGLRHVVISPGSRSTPLAMLCHEHAGIKDWILVDERSAAYFALGIAKKLKEPVALICTSGTAAANYFPAIVEAHHGRVPLVVLTADRPHELRGIGASQTIEQIQMYGEYVKDFQEMALPEASESMLRYVRNRASRAVRIAKQENQGPVHVNFPFREPLVPDFTLHQIWGERESMYNEYVEGKKQLAEEQLQRIANQLSTYANGLFVCGPQTDENLVRSLVALSERLQIPILADPLSQLRAGDHPKATIISSYDTFFRTKDYRQALQPDYIVRFGAMPISKSYLFFTQEHAECLQFVVENKETMREPTNHASEYIFADGSKLCEALLPLVKEASGGNWLAKWQTFERTTQRILANTTAASMTEGEAVRLICQELPTNSDVFVANSMPVRDIDTFFQQTDKDIIIHANRGASGIDGVTSTALGIAAVTRKHMTLIIGDLSFYHDLNGLLAAHHYKIDITIILINNNGGGIFSFLPQAKEERYFEALFGTPLHIDFEKVVTMYEGHFQRVDDLDALSTALDTSYRATGLSVIEVCTERGDNAAWHQTLWDQVRQGLMNNDS